MHTRTEGIVLKEMRFRETSKILTIYSRKYGKISAMARGAYKPKSQLIANTQPFSYNDYYLFKGKSFYYINQAEIIDSFYSIRENINRVMYGSYVLELMEVSTLEGETHEKLFLLLKEGLLVLSQLDRDFLKFILAYELKYISFLGYKPSLDKCVNCGKVDFANIGFNIELGGIVCNECRTLSYYTEYIDINMYKAMRALLYTPLNKLDSLKIPKDTLFKLHEIMVKYILNKIDRKEFNTLNILKSMKESGGI